MSSFAPSRRPRRAVGEEAAFLPGSLQRVKLLILLNRSRYRSSHLDREEYLVSLLFPRCISGVRDAVVAGHRRHEVRGCSVGFPFPPAPAPPVVSCGHVHPHFIIILYRLGLLDESQSDSEDEQAVAEMRKKLAARNGGKNGLASLLGAENEPKDSSDESESETETTTGIHESACRAILFRIASPVTSHRAPPTRLAPHPLRPPSPTLSGHADHPPTNTNTTSGDRERASDDSVPSTFADMLGSALAGGSGTAPKHHGLPAATATATATATASPSPRPPPTGVPPRVPRSVQEALGLAFASVADPSPSTATNTPAYPHARTPHATPDAFVSLHDLPPERLAHAFRSSSVSPNRAKPRVPTTPRYRQMLEQLALAQGSSSHGPHLYPHPSPGSTTRGSLGSASPWHTPRDGHGPARTTNTNNNTASTTPGRTSSPVRPIPGLARQFPYHKSPAEQQAWVDRLVGRTEAEVSRAHHQWQTERKARRTEVAALERDVSTLRELTTAHDAMLAQALQSRDATHAQAMAHQAREHENTLARLERHTRAAYAIQQQQARQRVDEMRSTVGDSAKNARNVAIRAIARTWDMHHQTVVWMAFSQWRWHGQAAKEMKRRTTERAWLGWVQVVTRHRTRREVEIRGRLARALAGWAALTAAGRVQAERVVRHAASWSHRRLRRTFLAWRDAAQTLGEERRAAERAQQVADADTRRRTLRAWSQITTWSYLHRVTAEAWGTRGERHVARGVLRAWREGCASRELQKALATTLVDRVVETEARWRARLALLGWRVWTRRAREGEGEVTNVARGVTRVQALLQRHETEAALKGGVWAAWRLETYRTREAARIAEEMAMDVRGVAGAAGAVAPTTTTTTTTPRGGPGTPTLAQVATMSAEEMLGGTAGSGIGTGGGGGGGGGTPRGGPSWTSTPNGKGGGYRDGPPGGARLPPPAATLEEKVERMAERIKTLRMERDGFRSQCVKERELREEIVASAKRKIGIKRVQIALRVERWATHAEQKLLGQVLRDWARLAREARVSSMVPGMVPYGAYYDPDPLGGAGGMMVVPAAQLRSKGGVPVPPGPGSGPQARAFGASLSRQGLLSGGSTPIASPGRRRRSGDALDDVNVDVDVDGVEMGIKTVGPSVAAASPAWTATGGGRAAASLESFAEPSGGVPGGGGGGVGGGVGGGPKAINFQQARAWQVGAAPVVTGTGTGTGTGVGFLGLSQSAGASGSGGTGTPPTGNSYAARHSHKVESPTMSPR